MNKDNLAITALIGSYDGSELEGLDPLKEGDDYFFPAIECAKRLGYHNPRDAIRRHCKREAKIKSPGKTNLPGDFALMVSCKSVPSA